MQELVGESFRGDVDYIDTRVVLGHLVLDSRKKMSLSKPGIAVNKQRIVFFVLLLGYRLCRRICKIVRRTYDEVVEGICYLVVMYDIVNFVSKLAAVADIIEFCFGCRDIVLDNDFDLYRLPRTMVNCSSSFSRYIELMVLRLKSVSVARVTTFPSMLMGSRASSHSSFADAEILYSRT